MTPYSPNTLYTCVQYTYPHREGGKEGDLTRKKVGGANASQNRSKKPTGLTVSPVNKLFQTPVKTTFRVWCPKIYLVYAFGQWNLGGGGAQTHCKDAIPKIWNKYSQKRKCAALVPVSMFMCLWAIYIFAQFVCLFCCRKIYGLILGIYKSLTETWMWNWGPAICFWEYINGIFVTVRNKKVHTNLGQIGRKKQDQIRVPSIIKHVYL